MEGKYKNITMTAFDLKKQIKEAEQRGHLQAMVIFLALLMEEPEFEGNDVRMTELIETIDRWELAMNEKRLLNVKKVKALVENKTGFKLLFKEDKHGRYN